MQATRAVTTPKVVAEELLALWRHLVAGGDRRLQRALEKHALGLTELKALQALDECDCDLSVKDVAEALGMSLPSASRAVDALLRRGLLERREDEHDRRLKRVRLTKAGRDVNAELFAARCAGLEAFVASLPEEHRERLHAALSPLLADLTEDRP